MAEKKMDIYVTWDPAAEGITERSLRMLRTALVAAYRRPTAIVEVPTSDGTCGFLVVIRRPADPRAGSCPNLMGFPERIQLEAVWSGDGFRADGGGEGGRGMQAAAALLRIFGISWRVILGEPWLYEHKAFAGLDDAQLTENKFQALHDMAAEAAAGLSDEAFAVPADLKPGY